MGLQAIQFHASPIVVAPVTAADFSKRPTPAPANYYYQDADDDYTEGGGGAGGGDGGGGNGLANRRGLAGSSLTTRSSESSGGLCSSRALGGSNDWPRLCYSGSFGANFSMLVRTTPAQSAVLLSADGEARVQTAIYATMLPNNRPEIIS